MSYGLCVLQILISLKKGGSADVRCKVRELLSASSVGK